MSIIDKLLNRRSRQSILDETVSLRRELEEFKAANRGLQQMLSDKEAELEELKIRLTRRIEKLEAEVLKSDGRLTDAVAKRNLTNVSKGRLKELEAAVRSAPEQIQGSTMIYDVRKKTTSIVNFTSRQEALKIIGRAKRGTIRIV